MGLVSLASSETLLKPLQALVASLGDAISTDFGKQVVAASVVAVVTNLFFNLGNQRLRDLRSLCLFTKISSTQILLNYLYPKSILLLEESTKYPKVSYHVRSVKVKYVILKQNAVDCSKQVSDVYSYLRFPNFYTCVYGAPGAGKSTIVLQALSKFGNGHIYVSISTPNTTLDVLAHALADAVAFNFVTRKRSWLDILMKHLGILGLYSISHLHFYFSKFDNFPRLVEKSVYFMFICLQREARRWRAWISK